MAKKSNREPNKANEQEKLTKRQGKHQHTKLQNMSNEKPCFIPPVPPVATGCGGGRTRRPSGGLARGCRPAALHAEAVRRARGPGARGQLQCIEVPDCGHAPALNVPQQLDAVLRFIESA